MSLNQNNEVLPHEKNKSNIVIPYIKPFLCILAFLIVVFVISFIFYESFLEDHKLNANLIQKYV